MPNPKKHKNIEQKIQSQRFRQIERKFNQIVVQSKRKCTNIHLKRAR